MDKMKEALFHDGTAAYRRYNKDTGVCSLILRTAPFNSIMARLILKRSDEYEVIPMQLVSRDALFYYFEADIAATGTVRYHFEVENQMKIAIYDASGCRDYADSNNDFEYTVGFDVPEWSKGAIMYQIMTDRFCNGDPSNDVLSGEYIYIGKSVTRIVDWEQNPDVDDTREFYGGDLQGVIDKLDYLKKMGVEVIYLNPIFVSPSNHKYDTQDYDYVDPHIGKIVNDKELHYHSIPGSNREAEVYRVRTTDKANLEASNELFIELVESAHKRGIKVILDGVFNHCGSFNKWLDREGVYEGREGYLPGASKAFDSPYREYFGFEEGRLDKYEAWWGFDTLPKLNYEGSRKLCEYIYSVGRKWVSPPYNADGWRLDVAEDLGHSPEFNHEFWRGFRNAVKEANPEAIILAEHYGDASSWLKGDQWDTVMNYDGFMEPVSWFLTGVDKHSDNANPALKGDGIYLKNAIEAFYAKNQTGSVLCSMNELSNHDHSRFLTRTNGMVGRIESVGAKAAADNVSKAIFKQGVIMQMTLPGAPTIYYGDEAGLCGWTDPDNRRTYPWGKEDLELLEFYREACWMHREFEALKKGSYLMLLAGKDVVCYGRFTDKNIVITAINTSDEDMEISVDSWRCGLKDGEGICKRMETCEEFYNVGREEKIQENGKLTFRVKAKSSIVFAR